MRTKYIYDSDMKFVEDAEIVETINEFDKDLNPIVDKMYEKIANKGFDPIQLENFIKERINYKLLYKILAGKKK